MFLGLEFVKIKSYAILLENIAKRSSYWISIFFYAMPKGISWVNAQYQKYHINQINKTKLMRPVFENMGEIIKYDKYIATIILKSVSNSPIVDAEYLRCIYEPLYLSEDVKIQTICKAISKLNATHSNIVHVHPIDMDAYKAVLNIQHDSVYNKFFQKMHIDDKFIDTVFQWRNDCLMRVYEDHINENGDAGLIMALNASQETYSSPEVLMKHAFSMHVFQLAHVLYQNSGLPYSYNDMSMHEYRSAIRTFFKKVIAMYDAHHTILCNTDILYMVRSIDTTLSIKEPTLRNIVHNCAQAYSETDLDALFLLSYLEFLIKPSKTAKEHQAFQDMNLFFDKYIFPTLDEYIADADEAVKDYINIAMGYNVDEYTLYMQDIATIVS